MLFRKAMPRVKSSTRSMPLSFQGGINSWTAPMYAGDSSARIAYNCNGNRGALMQDFGVCQYEWEGDGIECQQGIMQCWQLVTSNSTEYVLFCQDFKLYSWVDGQLTKISDVMFAPPVTGVMYNLDGDNIIILANKVNGMYIYNGQTLEKVSGAPSFVSVAVHYERLFGVTGKDNILWFSDDLDPTNWDIDIAGAGYIDLADERGRLLAVVSFRDFLYVFRENGITKITASADQTEFAVNHLFTASGTIYARTIAVCGDKILFLSDDGLFTFNGYTAKRLLPQLLPIISTSNRYAVGCYAEGKYLLAMSVMWNDNKVIGDEGSIACNNNALLSIDIYNGQYALNRGIDVGDMVLDRTNNKVILTTRHIYKNKLSTLTDNGKYYDTFLPKFWQLQSNDLGNSDKDKRLDYINIYTQHAITLIVDTGQASYRYYIQGSNKAQKIPMRVKGKLFDISIETDSASMMVSKPTIVYTTFH